MKYIICTPGGSFGVVVIVWLQATIGFSFGKDFGPYLYYCWATVLQGREI